MILSTFTILIGLSIVGLGASFITAPFLLHLVVVYGQPTPEQEELGTNDDGEKKAYTDCKGYENYTESKGISKKDADSDTEAVDVRINNLNYNINSNPESENREELIKERDCLSAIRAIENNAMVELADITNDFKELGEIYNNQGANGNFVFQYRVELKE